MYRAFIRSPESRESAFIEITDLPVPGPPLIIRTCFLSTMDLVDALTIFSRTVFCSSSSTNSSLPLSIDPTASANCFDGLIGDASIRLSASGPAPVLILVLMSSRKPVNSPLMKIGALFNSLEYRESRITRPVSQLCKYAHEFTSNPFE